MKILIVLSVLLLSGCGSGDEPEASKPSAVPPAAAAEMTRAPEPPPEPEPEPEPEKIEVWAGDCYASGVKVWYGKATEIEMGDRTEFTDEIGSKKVYVTGAHSCVWRYDGERLVASKGS